jgi:hypothetical protein
MKTSIIALLATLIFISPVRADDDTCRIQERLSERGYFTGEITCTYGDRTYEAVRKFQIDNGLHVDGIAGEDTRRVLFADVERKSPEPRERRPEMTDQDRFARCGDEVVSASVTRGWEGRGIKGAIKAWSDEVRGPGGLGLEYSQWENATDKTLKCLPVGVLTAVNCTAAARPCKSGN